MSGFGTNIKVLMDARKLSVAELARAIGEPQKTVQEWVQKDRFPREPGVIKKLSEALGCSVHRVLFGTEDPNGLVASLLDKTEIHTGLYEISIKKVTPK